MLTKDHRKHIATGPGGFNCSCCDSDGRAHKKVRRTARRVEKQAWKKNLY